MPAASVRVYTVDLDLRSDGMERLDALMPPAERDVAPARRVARAATRVVLARELGVAPGAIAISRRCEHCGDPAHGRPTLAGGAGPVFSVSHSGARALVAVTDEARLGVDVEQLRPRTRLDALAARVMDDAEHDAWLAIEGDEARLHAFLEAWTAKEAYLKAVGIGIATRLRSVDPCPPGWCSCVLDAGEGYVATLAVQAADVRVVPCAFSFATTSDGTAG